ncbi:PAS domain S-box-containing protein [Rhizobium binae]|uniref:histidine kinase n=1 Tax=Rhizobium binae TaxID=1138190 RepID=A0ABV2MHA6_9HYPH|nr:AAA family ATPase [Rhizobium binae]MBX4995003.1 AAA family ATPase [Rhizobium binae]NKL50292.1 AAA family ATPase [Rhizobium leguminosarum bv. viciae]QSY85083.1 AAA family ATPase [Rhizobium binae]
MEVLWEDGDRVFHRQRRLGADGKWNPVLVVLSALEYPTPSSLGRLDHEYGLKDELDSAWAVRPLELVREGGRTMLVLEDPGSEPLARRLGTAMETGLFLRLAISIAAALGRVHQRGLVHKDIKPANILVTGTGAEVRLTGFGIASRLSRERQALEPPEVVAGTLAYMAPEQTGRMNRSIDSRSDLYALGVTLYEMLTGSLPFAASDPMEWVHCHIARQPMPPNERTADASPAVSAIVLKLLAKTAEERYQTAGGVERDLRRCLSQWEMHGRIEAFPLGERDIPDRLLIPEKLYGREHEVETMLAAFDRVVLGGGPELVLVGGYSGIGKSAVVNELHKVLVPPRGLFASGKFDQYKQDIPYATLAQAFQGLLEGLLAKSEAELAPWREALSETLGPNAKLMVDLVPELKLVIGDQPSVSELPPQDAQRRFQLVFRRFISVFARPEHPLALFLDDLQWLDAATLDLLQDLLTRSDLQHLMLIGAYRDNEVTADHPLMRTLDVIGTAGGKVSEITLAPLTKYYLQQLIADTLHCQPDRVAPLARMMHDKTGGNPFFVRQFLFSLAEEGVLAFDYRAACWSWDLKRIHAKGYTDNVVDLMVGKLSRQPPETRKALQQFACLGNTADIRVLSLVLGTPEEQVAGALWPAVAHELLERLAGTYRFVHDRVQEAAYSLIPEDRRGELHLHIGRLLAANTTPERIDDHVFEIVSQLNRGAALITSAEEREQLAEFNLMAGKRAKASTAYASALNYFVGGTIMLSGDRWERQHQLAFALELNRAECEFLLGALPDAENRLAQLSSCAVGSDDQAAVACLRIDLYAALGQTSRSADVGLDYLRQYLGVDWSPHPAAAEVQREYDRIWSQLGSRAIKDLIDLPLMSDPASSATLDILTRLVGAVWHTDANLACMAICLAVNLSLERGNSDGSCYHYVSLGYIAGPRFGDYEAGFRFGQLGCQLVEKHDLKRFQARTYKDFGAHVIPWTRHVRSGRDMLRRALEIADQSGDLTFAGYSYASLNSNLLAAGDPLMEVQQQAEIGLTFAQKVQFQFVIDLTSAQVGLVRTLRGLTRKFGSFDDDGFDEIETERRFSENPNLAEICYFVRKLQARFFAGDYGAAVDASLRAQRLPWTSVAHFEETPEHHFYGALSRAACCDDAVADRRARHMEALVFHHRQLQIYAKNCPENFENRAALVGAEIARLEGREIDAVRLYEQAIRAARTNGFLHHEALAYELAARFYAQGGFEDFSRLYLRNARGCYLRWGADGKVRQLDQLYPDLRGDERGPTPTSTIGAPVEQLDLATVIKISQAVSGEIVLQKLIDTVLRTAVEQAGAERGLLILPHGGESRIAAEATTCGEAVAVHMLDEIVTQFTLPQSLLRYVLRTNETVVLDDAAAQNPFAADPYVCQHRARSVVCAPLLNQGQLTGVLYLENNLAPRVFAPARIAVLKLLASQAAISLENTRLYRDLAEREARFRRLVKANIIGIIIWDIDGRIFEANDAFLRMLGYDREDLASGRLSWTDLTPVEWRDRDARTVAELRMRGAVQPFEKEYFRKDGTRLPVLIGGALLEESRNEGVSFVLDLTERRQAEEALRESEEALREVQGQLAHANRVATMGQFTASIAHEVNQPLAASLTNAQAGLRWLGTHPPNLEEATQALGRIVENANRASDVIGRIRALIKKEPARKERFDLNEAIRHVIALTGSEVLRQGVTLRTEFATGLPPVQGDRVQLQQVILNLIMNAIEAMSGNNEEQRELLISTEIGAAGGVVVGVRDSGPGLDPQTIDRVFEAFYTTKSSGMGMGLAICRSIIEAHGGRMWATASEPRGAVFLFTLPLEPDETAGAKHGANGNVGKLIGPTTG